MKRLTTVPFCLDLRPSWFTAADDSRFIAEMVNAPSLLNSSPGTSRPGGRTPREIHGLGKHLEVLQSDPHESESSL